LTPAFYLAQPHALERVRPESSPGDHGGHDQQQLKDAAWLLTHLANEGVIRPIPLRTFHFPLAHGATAPHALVPLATNFDPTSPCEPAAIEEHAELVATVLVEGLRLAPQ
jgi:hypothetical protein